MVRLERLWPKLAYVMKIGFASWFVLVSNRGGGTRMITRWKSAVGEKIKRGEKCSCVSVKVLVSGVGQTQCCLGSDTVWRLFVSGGKCLR